MNLKINVINYNLRCCPENENIFNDEFWDNLDFVISAVDNVEARLYLDEKCIFHLKPFINAGTMGINADQQVYLPFKTMTYHDTG